MNKMNNNVHTFGDVRTVDQVFLSWSTTDEVCAGVVKPHDKVKSTQQLKICLSLYAWQWASYISRIWFMKYRPVLVSNLFLLPELDFCFVLLYFFLILFFIFEILLFFSMFFFIFRYNLRFYLSFHHTFYSVKSPATLPFYSIPNTICVQLVNDDINVFKIYIRRYHIYQISKDIVFSLFLTEKKMR